MSRPIPVTIIKDGPGLTFVYDGMPKWETLIASRNPTEDYQTDLFGRSVPPGDWCAEGYRIAYSVEVWPGAMLERADNKYSVKLESDSE